MLFCLARTLAQVLAMTALWDYENWLLSKYNIELGIPVGTERLTHESWVQHVKNDLPNSTSSMSKPAMATSGFSSASFHMRS